MSTALDLFEALPIAVEPEVDALRVGLPLASELEFYEVANRGKHGNSGEQHPLRAARAFIAKSLSRLPLETVSEAWRLAYYRGEPLRGLRSLAVKEAFRIASSSLLPERARDAAWFILDEWESGLEESWPTFGRNRWRAASLEWRRKVHTQVDRDREARIAEAHDARRSPEQRAARDAFLERTKPTVSTARRDVNRRKRKGDSE